jgi:hypothetical protein
MFSEVGKKIKGLCKFVFGVMVVVSFIIAIAVFAGRVSSGEAEDILLGMLLFVIIGGVGVFISWLSVLFLYAYGEIVEANQTRVKQNKKIIQLLSGGKEIEDEEEEEVKSCVHFVSSDYGNIMNMSNKLNGENKK